MSDDAGMLSSEHDEFGDLLDSVKRARDGDTQENMEKVLAEMVVVLLGLDDRLRSLEGRPPRDWQETARRAGTSLPEAGS